MTDQFADVNNIKICYRIDGKGYPIILIHGFGSKKESFMGQVPILSQKFKVISFDQRGAGKSDRPNIPYSMEMFADDIGGLMDYLDIEKSHIVGLSLGGMIALNFVLKYPHRVNKLIIINTIAKIPNDFDPEPYIQTRIKGLEFARKNPEKAFWQSTQFGFYHEFRKRMLANPKEKFYGLWSVEDLLEYYKSNPSRAQDIRNIALSFKTHNTFELLSEINHKTLLLTASHDVLVPKERMFEIHERIPNSVYKIIEEAGHESPKSKAPEVNKEIIDFFEN